MKKINRIKKNYYKINGGFSIDNWKEGRINTKNMIKQLNSEAEKDYYKMLQAEILLKK